MAITRCPYCRAIIDEKDRFCTSCGTQLLYAEDAEVEEDIPGERITHADVEEKDYTIPEPEGEESGDVIIRDEEPGETAFLEGEEGEAAAEPAASEDGEREEGRDEEGEEEGVLVDESAEATAESREFRELASVLLAEEEKEGVGEKAGEEEPPEETKLKPARREPRADQPKRPRRRSPGAVPDEEKVDREPLLFSLRPEDAEPLKAEEPPAEEEAEPPAVEQEEQEEQESEAPVETSPEGEGAPPPPARKDMTFDTEELNRIGPTVDLAHRQVEEFLKVLKEEEDQRPAARPVAPPPAPETKDTQSFDTGLPPWVKEMRKSAASAGAETPAGLDERDEDELRAEEEEEAERVIDEAQGEEESRTDSGVGLPEKTQAKLSFGSPGRSVSIEEEPPAARRPYEFEDVRAARRPAPPRPPFHLGNFLKAKSFDVLFLTAIWLVCLWLAADRLNGTIFELFNVASDALFAFGGILLVLYFFLFYFFLGETLGDRLFRDWDEEGAED